MARIKALFFIPHLDTDGRDLSDEIDDLEFEMYVRFVGWTKLGVVEGTYRMADGTEAFDVSNAYMVVMEVGRIDELETMLRAFKARTKQESIFLEIQYNVDVRFI